MASFQNGVRILQFNLQNPQLFSATLPAPKLMYFFGQPGTNKEDQLSALFREYQIKSVELYVDVSADYTADNIMKLPQLPPQTVLVIRKAHRLRYQLDNPVIRQFSLGLKDLDEFVVAIGDEPCLPMGEDRFYDQFPVMHRFLVDLPTQEQVQALFKSYFESTNAVAIDLADDDYLWLAQCSDFCRPLDVHEFYKNVIYTVHASHAVAPDTEIRVTRDYLEDPNNKFLHDHGGGILSISARHSRMEQQRFTGISQTSIIPREPELKRQKV